MFSLSKGSLFSLTLFATLAFAVPHPPFASSHILALHFTCPCEPVRFFALHLVQEQVTQDPRPSTGTTVSFLPAQTPSRRMPGTYDTGVSVFKHSPRFPRRDPHVDASPRSQLRTRWGPRAGRFSVGRRTKPRPFANFPCPRAVVHPTINFRPFLYFPCPRTHLKFSDFIRSFSDIIIRHSALQHSLKPKTFLLHAFN
jgi:hypothetical protein